MTSVHTCVCVCVCVCPSLCMYSRTYVFTYKCMHVKAQAAASPGGFTRKTRTHKDTQQDRVRHTHTHTTFSLNRCFRRRSMLTAAYTHPPTATPINPMPKAPSSVMDHHAVVDTKHSDSATLARPEAASLPSGHDRQAPLPREDLNLPAAHASHIPPSGPV